MATVEEDSTWSCTVDIQNELIKLHSSDKKEWKRSVTSMILNHASKFSILTVGASDDGDNLYTFDEFRAHFAGTIDNETLLSLIYNDMDHHDPSHIKYIAIHRWINSVKQYSDNVVIKDHKWLFTKMLHVQAAHLDADGSGDIDRDEFTEYFVEKIGFPVKMAYAIFDDIDVNNDGDLSVMEYTKWKNKHNKPDKLAKFMEGIPLKKKNKKTKCSKCEIFELKLKSINSKHSNLLQDYKKLSSLLDSEREKENNNNDNNENQELKKKIKELSEINDDFEMNINKLLMEKTKELKSEKEEIECLMEKQKNEIKTLKSEIEEETEHIDKMEKEKRKIKSELTQKDVEITVLKHKFKLFQHKNGSKKENEKNIKYENEIKSLKQQIGETQHLDRKYQEKQKEIENMKFEIGKLKDLIEKHDFDRDKLSTEKQELTNKIEKEKNNQFALIQQFEELENNKNELNSLKEKYKIIENKLEIKEEENVTLKKKVQTEKNQLIAVLREVEELEQKQKDLEMDKINKLAIQSKHDLSKLEIQIEILNSDSFRMKSLLLLSKYEKLNKKKYYGFLDFAENDLSNKALKNILEKLKVKNEIQPQKLAPLLAVIVKLYLLRLNKLKTGKNNKSNDEIDRRIIEHLCVWLIRKYSKPTKQTQIISVLNDKNEMIKREYIIYDGNIEKKELTTLLASWCNEYIECYGRHQDSKLN